jgi:pectate lyase
MKKTKLLSIVILLLCLNNIYATDALAPVGWATKASAGVPTGGGNATPVTVTTFAALKTQLTSSSAAVIYVSGTITFTSHLSVSGVSNKTVIGLPGSVLTNLTQTKDGSGTLYFSDCSNIILRNLTFVGPGAYDCDGWDNLCFDNVTRAWVDHCDFQDGCDGNFDIKNATDYLSVTWCKFWYKKAPTAGGSGGTDDHRFSDLLGSSDSDTGDAGHLNITFQYCWWGSGCVERMPRVRFGNVHIANCYYNSTVNNLGITAGYNANVRVENTVFEGLANPLDLGKLDGTAVLYALGNTYTSCTTSSSTGKKADGLYGTGTGTAFTVPYTLALAGVSTVKSVVSDATCGAGATLLVNTTTNTITSGCTATTPTLELTSGSNTQSLYTGTAIASIVYTYGGTATGVTLTGTLPTNVTGTLNTTSKTYTISGTPTTAGTYNYTVTTTQASGTAVALTGTITTSVQQPATLTLTSGSASQTAYVGSPISTIVYTYGGGATNVTVTGLPTGVSSAVNATAKTVTISGTPTATNTGSYSIVTVGGSSPVTLTGTITVNTPTTLSTPSNITASATNTSISLNWDAVSNASKYVINLCSSGSTVADNILFNETFATQTATTGSVTSSTFTYDKTWTKSTGTVYLTDANAITLNGACRIVSSDMDLRDTNTVIQFDAKYMTGYTPVSGDVCAVSINDASATNAGLRFTVASDLSIKLGISGGTGTPTILGATTLTSSYQTFKVKLRGYYVAALDGTDHISIRTQTSPFIPITIKNIKIYIPSATSTTTTCQSDTVSGTSYTFSGLTSSTDYTYQIQALSTLAAYTSGSYSTAASITTTGTTTDVKNEAVSGLKITQTADAITVSGAEVASLNIYNITGAKIASDKGSQSIGIGSLTKGVYVIQVTAKDGSVTSKKFLK